MRVNQQNELNRLSSDLQKLHMTKDSWQQLLDNGTVTIVLSPELKSYNLTKDKVIEIPLEVSLNRVWTNLLIKDKISLLEAEIAEIINRLEELGVELPSCFVCLDSWEVWRANHFGKLPCECQH